MKKMLNPAFCCLALWIFCALFDMISLVAAAPAADASSLYQAKGRRDPFVQLVSAGSAQKTGSLLAVESPDDLIVEGVACDGQKGCIVIANGTVMSEGESVGSVKAVKVSSEGATFLVNDMEVFKAVYQEETAESSMKSSQNS